MPDSAALPGDGPCPRGVVELAYGTAEIEVLQRANVL